jgi:membrane protease YdiL (CAAX protease family)
MSRGNADVAPMRRFFAFPLVRLVLIVGAFVGATIGLVALRGHGTVVNDAAFAWMDALLLAIVIVVVERACVGRAPAEVGFAARHLLRDSALGLAGGAALFSAVIVELLAAGAYRVEAVHPSAQVLASALWLIPAAATEELLFRGALFRLVAEWAGTWIGLGVSALLFGTVHAFNPGATWFSTVAIALEAGVLLGAIFVVTRSLWAPIALHFAWNFCEGPVYGTQLSGLTIRAPLFEAHLNGPAWLTGGSFGPEASVPALLTCCAAAAALLLYAYRNGSILAPAWVARRAAPQ